MYSTKLKDERLIIDSIMVLEKARIVQFVVDTGAKFTCCNYKAFDKTMREDDFTGCEVRTIGGFVEGSAVKFYKCGLKQIIFIADSHTEIIYFCKDRTEYKSNLELLSI